MIICTDKEYFFRNQKKMTIIPFSQSEAWYNYMISKQKKIALFIDNNDNPNLFTWGIEEKTPLSNKKIIRFEGESYNIINDKLITEFYSKLCQLDYLAIEINSNNRYYIDFEIGIRRAGFLRPIASFNCPLTLEINFKNDIIYNRNWKRNYKLAVKNNLIFEEVKNLEEIHFEQIEKMFYEMSILKSLNYKIQKKELKALLTSNFIRTFFVYDKTMQPLASRIIYYDKNLSADVIAANSNKAREFGATFFIIQNILELLKKEEVKCFDFSRIAPSTNDSDNVYLFKNSIESEKVQYNGEWSFYKNKTMELAMFFYKIFKLKKQRY